MPHTSAYTHNPSAQSERDELSRNAGASDSVAASSSAQMEVLERQRAALQAAKDAAEAEAERLSSQLIQAQSGARALEAETTRLRCAAASSLRSRPEPPTPSCDGNLHATQGGRELT